jgi:putative methyltransferase (TIGR04325 family)
MGLFRKFSQVPKGALVQKLASKDATYNSKRIAEVVVAKNKQLREDLYSTKYPTLNFILLRPLIVFALTKNKKLRVFDLGGGGGTHYLVARKFIESEIELVWAVVETPAMVAEAQTLREPELLFFDNSDSASRHLGTIDIAIASGVFQYLNDPLEALEDFLNLEAKYIFITRTALSNSVTPMVEIQKSRLKDNGPGRMPDGFVDEEINYPLTVVNIDLFRRILETKYEIICEIEEDRSVHRIGAVTVDQFGFLCRKK